MKYISLDIETLGLDTDKDSILQIGAAFDDTENQLPLDKIPTFEIFVDDGVLHGNKFAFNMHVKSGLWERWDKSDNKVPLSEAVNRLIMFIHHNYKYMIPNGVKVNLAGKNIGKFDFHCLRRDKNFFEFVNRNCNHRFLDPAQSFIDYKKDIVSPDLRECKKRAGLGDVETAHDALVDCLDVVQLVRFIANKS